jgi:hypothetical protein
VRFFQHAFSVDQPYQEDQKDYNDNDDQDSYEQLTASVVSSPRPPWSPRFHLLWPPPFFTALSYLSFLEATRGRAG